MDWMVCSFLLTCKIQAAYFKIHLYTVMCVNLCIIILLVVHSLAVVAFFLFFLIFHILYCVLFTAWMETFALCAMIYWHIDAAEGSAVSSAEQSVPAPIMWGIKAVGRRWGWHVGVTCMPASTLFKHFRSALAVVIVLALTVFCSRSWPLAKFKVHRSEHNPITY